MVKKHKNARWEDIMYVKAYIFAKQGLRSNKLAEALGITRLTLLKWKKTKPTLVQAIQMARQTENGTDTMANFNEYVYKKLDPRIKPLWDKIRAANGDTGRINTVMESCGKYAKMHLFFHALSVCNFNKSKAASMVGLSTAVVDRWVREEPYFKQLLKMFQEYKKDFFEEYLVRLVKQGDTTATIFANKTLNRDRGYTDKQIVEHVGSIDHVHSMQTMADLEPYLSVETKRELLEAMRKHKESLKRLQEQAMSRESLLALEDQSQPVLKQNPSRFKKGENRHTRARDKAAAEGVEDVEFEVKEEV